MVLATPNAQKRVLADLGFQDPHNVNDRTSVADLYKPGKRCGIYVLHFETGEHYAGQAVDVTRRYCQHRQTHGDIVGISFKPAPENNLDDEEKTVVWTLEEKGFKLRNIALTSIPKGESDFDQIMSEADQERWLHDFAFIDKSGPRLSAPDLRRKYHRKYKRLMNMPHATEIVQVLRTYVQLGIPAIRRGELDFWSVSCLPNKPVYARINIYWQEVCTPHIYKEDPWFAFQIAKSPLAELSRVEKLILTIRHKIKYGPTKYKHGGPDQIQLFVPLHHVEGFIENSTILAGIRLFNLRSMKKGPNVNARSHCMDLADNLV